MVCNNIESYKWGEATIGLQLSNNYEFMYINYPNVLVISIESLSKSTSNGRTLGNCFYGWPKNKLAQFCLKLNDPDYDLCDNYYCISDLDALKAFLCFKKAKRLTYSYNSSYLPNYTSGFQKNAFRMLLRNVVWKTGVWKTHDFYSWVDNFMPNVVIIQNADSPFILDIARFVANRKRIPLIIYNTEGFSLFKNNWMNKNWLDFICFPIFKFIYTNSFNKLIKKAQLSIYINDLLREDYVDKYNKTGIVLYPSSIIGFNPKLYNDDIPTFSYLGNFGFDRPDALVAIANMIHSISNNYVLDIYGKATNKQKEMFDSCKSIKYHGLVDYNKVKEVIQDTDFLIHVENQKSCWEESLKYGFSGKIADCISSGNIFILYASLNIACSKYILATGAGVVSDNLDILKDEIIKIISSRSYKKIIQIKEKQISQDNHNLLKNSHIFLESINRVIEKFMYK